MDKHTKVNKMNIECYNYASVVAAQNSSWVPIFLGNTMTTDYSRYYTGVYRRDLSVEFNVLFNAIKRK